ncbi:protein disulfide oxidoreductase [Mycobacterium sp. 663a-19]|uniref:protein disulfide oxidoreductase n=1 Tax=Mycobacterium sp. 663a-19 TaxID=2986148 RepID=UPI003B642A37
MRNAMIRLLSPLRLFAAAVCAAALIFGLAEAPRAKAADDRLQFTATTLSGAPFNGASLQGRPAVLWFWTPWCPFCNAEAPGVSQVAAANPGVAFVGVAAHSDVGQMQSFVSKYNLNFPNLNDADGSIWARYNVPWQPAYVFYRSDGSSTFVNNPTSAMSQQELAGRVAALTH